MISESYDPKLSVLSIVLSSLFIYNLNHEIGIKDISTLHSVVALSRIFENKLNQTFPFPKMMWIVQQFEHDLAELTIEGYLDFALQEKENPKDTDEIRKYNETVRVVQQFPQVDMPRIMLMSHPKKGILTRQLINFEFEDLDEAYRNQILQIRQLVNDRLYPKRFNHMAVNGECTYNLFTILSFSLCSCGKGVGASYERTGHKRCRCCIN